MKKAITLVALAGVAMTAEFEDDNLNVFKSIGNGLKKAGQFVVQHPKIITTAAALLLDDQELFSLQDLKNKEVQDAIIRTVTEDIQKVRDYATAHPELVERVKSEIYKYKKDKDLLKADARHAMEKIAEHPEILAQTAEALKKFAASHKLQIEADDHELFNKDLFNKITEDIKKGIKYAHEHPEVVQDGKNIVSDIKTHDKKKLVHDSLKTLLDLGFDDEELFNKDSFKKIAEKVKKGIHYVHEHPEVVQDGKNIVSDIKTHDKKKLIHDGIKTLLDLGFEDEEFFNKELFNKIAEDVKKGIKYAHEHPEVVEDGKNIVHDLKTHDKKQLIHHALKTLVDLGFEDSELEVISEEELFKIGKVLKGAVNGVKKGAEFVAGHPALIGDAKNIVRDVKSHNYGQLVKDGFKTYKDIRAEEDEELFNKDSFKKVIEGVKKGIKYAHEHPEVVADGKNIVSDIKTHDKKKLIHDGLKTLLDLGFEDSELETLSEEELFKIGKVLKGAVNGVKKGAEFVAGHPALIGDAKNIVRDVKSHNYGQLVRDGVKTYKDIRAEEDEEELFKIGKVLKGAVNGVKKGAEFVAGHPALIGDAKNIVRDVKSHNYGQLVRDGVKTYKDIRADDEEFFAFEDEELFSVKDTIHKGVDFVKKHPAVVADGAHIVRDIKGHNYGQLVKDGFQTYKHLGFEDQEFFAFDDEELFQVKEVHAFKDLGFEDQTDNQLFSLGDLIKDGKKIKDDIKHHNVKDLVVDGAKAVNHAKEVKKFLF